MENNDAKASIIALILAMLVIVAGLAIYFYSSISAPGHIEETPFGEWKSDIEVEYKDGSVLSLSTLKVTFSGKEINGFTYKLSTRATGEGYTGCEIDLTDMFVVPTIKKDGSSIYAFSKRYGSIEQVSLGDEWSHVYLYTVTAEDLENAVSCGTYELRFLISGTIRFRGMPNGDWAIGNAPSEIYISFGSDKGCGDTTSDDPSLPESASPTDPNPSGPTCSGEWSDYGPWKDYNKDTCYERRCRKLYQVCWDSDGNEISRRYVREECEGRGRPGCVPTGQMVFSLKLLIEERYPDFDPYYTSDVKYLGRK